MILMDSATASDEQLWRLACDGDREAFGRIVERYQSLVCSLAYSACGALGTSEDMAQETFITAWHRLKDLRDPGKLRQWLCGIVRNISANAVRRELRRGGQPQSLDAAADELCAAGDPADQAITREEETLLWRTLAEMPASYREPLVLFYREEKSVTEVALKLDLTEDTVKQRLSRGRAMLRDGMTVLVESALTRTRPTAAFTVAVLVALPMLSGSAASAALTAGAVASGGAAGTAGKGMLAKLGLGAFADPLIGLVCAYFGTRAAASTGRSTEERTCILRHARWIIAFCFAMSIGLAAVLSQAGKFYTPLAGWVVLGVCAWTVVLLGGIMLMCHRIDRDVKRIRLATNTTDEDYAGVLAVQGKQLRLPRYFESKWRLLGLPLFVMAWGGHSSDRYYWTRTVYGWIAVGDIAISPFLAFGGVAVAPIAVGGTTVGMLSLSLLGVAFGMFAFGSLAFGWWAVGFAAVGVKCAVGVAAVARDYAVGSVTSGTEAGTTLAKDWIKTQWPVDFIEVMGHQLHWWILGCVAFALALRFWRNRQAHREPAHNSHHAGS